MSEKGMQLKEMTAKMMEEENPKLIEYYQKTDFPFYMLDKIRDLGICGIDIKGYGGPELSFFDSCSIIYELARWDSSLGTFFIVQNGLSLHTISHLGSEEQKKRIIP